MNTGQESERQFERIFQKRGKNAFVFRLPDSKEVQGRTGKRTWVRSLPSDYIVTEYGKMYYAEVKSCGNKTSFPFSQLEKGQRNAIKRQKMAGGEYYIFIHRTRTNEWYCLPGSFTVNSSKKSIKWTEMASYKWGLANE